MQLLFEEVSEPPAIIPNEKDRVFIAGAGLPRRESHRIVRLSEMNSS